MSEFRIRGNTLAGQVVAAVLGAAATAIGGYLLAVLSSGWLIHQLGGVTMRDVQAEIDKRPAPQVGMTLADVQTEIAKHPGPQGPVGPRGEIGPPGPRSDLSTSAKWERTAVNSDRFKLDCEYRWRLDQEYSLAHMAGRYPYLIYPTVISGQTLVSEHGATLISVEFDHKDIIKDASSLRIAVEQRCPAKQD